MNNLMTPLKSLNNPNMLTPYEQFYIQALHQEGKFIPEISRRPEPSIPTGHSPRPYNTWQGQSNNIPHPGRIDCCPPPDRRPPATKGMYSESFSF